MDCVFHVASQKSRPHPESPGFCPVSSSRGERWLGCCVTLSSVCVVWCVETLCSRRQSRVYSWWVSPTPQLVPAGGFVPKPALLRMKCENWRPVYCRTSASKHGNSQAGGTGESWQGGGGGARWWPGVGGAGPGIVDDGASPEQEAGAGSSRLLGGRVRARSAGLTLEGVSIPVWKIRSCGYNPRFV